MHALSQISAANRVPGVGALVASYLDFLHENGFISSFNSVGLVGFSLGAHVAGHVGKNLRRGRLNFIIGLDPGRETNGVLIMFFWFLLTFKISLLAGPLFSVNNPSGRLDASDAEYVEAIHTNGPTLGFVGAGIGVSRRFSIDFEMKY